MSTDEKIACPHMPRTHIPDICCAAVLPGSMLLQIVQLNLKRGVDAKEQENTDNFPSDTQFSCEAYRATDSIHLRGRTQQPRPRIRHQSAAQGKGIQFQSCRRSPLLIASPVHSSSYAMTAMANPSEVAAAWLQQHLAINKRVENGVLHVQGSALLPSPPNLLWQLVSHPGKVETRACMT
jgi:hypothetical protein